MQHNLLFHILKKSDWKSHKKDTIYIPESVEQQGFIHCSTGDQINDSANRIFNGQRHLWLLIIDVNRVEAPIKYELDSQKNEKFPHIYGGLNIDAILDKISLNPDKKGVFDLQFSTD